MKKIKIKHKPLTLLLVLFLSVTLFFASSISVFSASVIPNHVQIDETIPVLKVSDLDSVSLKFINDYLADGSKYFVTVKGTNLVVHRFETAYTASNIQWISGPPNGAGSFKLKAPYYVTFISFDLSTGKPTAGKSSFTSVHQIANTVIYYGRINQSNSSFDTLFSFFWDIGAFRPFITSTKNIVKVVSNGKDGKSPFVPLKFDIPEPPTSSEPEPPTSSEPEPPTSSEPEPPVSSEPEPPTSSEPEPPVSSEPEPPTSSEPEPPVSSEPEPPVSSEPDPPTSSEPEPPIVINEDLLGFTPKKAYWFKDTVFDAIGMVTNVGLSIFLSILGIVVVIRIIRYFLD